MIIVLNGTSSSGKTSIAKVLQERLDGAYFLFGVDLFLGESMPLHIDFENKDQLDTVERSISGFNKSLRALAGSIDYFIVDHVLQYRSWLIEVATSLSGFDTFFVGVKAPLSVLEAREKLRSDRKPGTAREQIGKMVDYTYDFDVDTSSLSPSESADKIVRSLRPGAALAQYAIGQIP